MNLTQHDQHTLLSIAEWSIQDYLRTGKRHPLPDNILIGRDLKICTGVFVSVYVEKQLRGCIGTFSETEPLYVNVNQMAIQAATEDRRFKQIREEEIPAMDIEISVLTPRSRITGPDDIVIGKHGIYLIHGIRRATLLPQVAVKNGWNAVEFLECCSKNKLGLHKDSWKEAELYVYEAFIIH